MNARRILIARFAAPGLVCMFGVSLATLAKNAMAMSSDARAAEKPCCRSFGGQFACTYCLNFWAHDALRVHDEEVTACESSLSAKIRSCLSFSPASSISCGGSPARIFCRADCLLCAEPASTIRDVLTGEALLSGPYFRRSHEWFWPCA